MAAVDGSDEWTLGELLDACGDADQWDRLLGESPSLAKCRAVTDDLKTLAAQYVQDLAEENERLAAARGGQSSTVTKRSRKRGSNLTSLRRQELLREQALVLERQREVKPLIRDHEERQNTTLAMRYRAIIARMAQEIEHHQRSRNEVGDRVDEALWRVLDRETVVFGTDGSEESLRFMVEQSWGTRPRDLTDAVPAPDGPPDSAIFRPPGH